MLNYDGGDRGWSKYNQYRHYQTDWLGFNGDWKLFDNGKPIILHESVSVMGEYVYELCSKFNKSKVYTYIKPLNNIGPFIHVSIPYDLDIIRESEVVKNPLDRINAAFYSFKDKKFDVTSGGCLLSSIPWINSYNVRYDIINNKLAERPVIGSTLNDKINESKKYKYSMVCENCIIDGYISEKLLDAIAADTVPVYIGAMLPPYLEDVVIRPRDYPKIQEISDVSYLEKLDKVRKLRDSYELSKQFDYKLFWEKLGY